MACCLAECRGGARLVIVIGAGIGFPAILMAGLQFAPASDAGALAPGMLPFWTALVAAAMLGEGAGAGAAGSASA